MYRRILSLTNIGICSLLLLTWSCTKLDTTSLGSDLLPVVDNINTFADTFNINVTQGIFNDTTKIAGTEDHVLGKISTDPLFGQTTADIYLQLKPTFYPFYFGNANDTIQPFNPATDSVVLCLNYKGLYGDSTLPLQLQVEEINASGDWDSVYQAKTVNYFPSTTGAILGTKTIDIRRLVDLVYISNGKDSVSNQVRIKLDPSFAATLMTRDSVMGHPLSNAFYSDSTFRSFYKGFAIKATGGNALLYSSLVDPTTRLEVYFRKKNNGVLDTTYTSFTLMAVTSSIAIPSASANHIVRDRSGPVLNPALDEFYLQTAPGTYANLSIPSLDTLTNRIIHRAQISIEQIPTDPVSDNIMAAPNYLYLDLIDTGSVAKWKPIYFDLNPGVIYDPDLQRSSFYYPPDFVVDYSYFGGFVHHKTDVSGQSIGYYDINITRYIQQLVTHQKPNYKMRLFPAYNFSYPQYDVTGYPTSIIPYGNSVAYGRVRLGNSFNTNHKMRLIIIWSKLH